MDFQLIEVGAGNAAAWTRLRDHSGIGWDGSADCVLVSKRVISLLSYQRIVSGVWATDTACAVLGTAAAEQSGIRTALAHARAAEWSGVQRTENHPATSSPDPYRHGWRTRIGL